MNRLNKVLREKGIVFDAPDFPSIIEYDNCEHLVDIVGDMIITAWHSMVMPTQLKIYDRNFKLIGGQDLTKDDIWNKNPWSSFANLPFSKEHDEFIENLI